MQKKMGLQQRRWRLAIIATSAAMAVACASDGPLPAPPSTAPVSPGAPVYLLEDILGASPDAADALLGQPALTRREGDGEYRRYLLKGCALIILLYPDDNGAARVAHVDAAALSSDEQTPDLESCLAGG